MRQRRNETAGHSLMEMLVALAVCAILATAGMQGWHSLARSQRRAEGRAALLAAMQQQERHYSRHGRYQPFDAAAPGAFRWHSGPTPPGSAYLVDAAACEGETLQRCVLLAARPRHDDPACGTLRLDSRGRRAADGNPDLCWP